MATSLVACQSSNVAVCCTLLENIMDSLLFRFHFEIMRVVWISFQFILWESTGFLCSLSIRTAFDDKFYLDLSTKQLSLSHGWLEAIKSTRKPIRYRQRPTEWSVKPIREKPRGIEGRSRCRQVFRWIMSDDSSEGNGNHRDFENLAHFRKSGGFLSFPPQSAPAETPQFAFVDRTPRLLFS